jgi:hypothetical protein
MSGKFKEITEITSVDDPDWKRIDSVPIIIPAHNSEHRITHVLRNLVGIPPYPLGQNPLRPHKLCFVEGTIQYVLRPKNLHRKIIGRMYAFRPQVIGSFPDIISEDMYLMYSSLLHSGGYGVINDEISRVFYRLPATLLDTLNQYVVYRLGTSQFFKSYPDYEQVRIRPTDNTATSSKLENNFSLTQKIAARVITKIGSLIVKKIENTNPPTSSKRPRVLSSI